jgi:hypothetical protein
MSGHVRERLTQRLNEGFTDSQQSPTAGATTLEALLGQTEQQTLPEVITLLQKRRAHPLVVYGPFRELRETYGTTNLSFPSTAGEQTVRKRLTFLLNSQQHTEMFYAFELANQQLAQVSNVFSSIVALTIPEHPQTVEDLERFLTKRWDFVIRSILQDHGFFASYRWPTDPDTHQLTLTAQKKLWYAWAPQQGELGMKSKIRPRIWADLHEGKYSAVFDAQWSGFLAWLKQSTEAGRYLEHPHSDQWLFTEVADLVQETYHFHPLDEYIPELPYQFSNVDTAHDWILMVNDRDTKG